MIVTKRSFLRFFFVAEIVLFTFLYIFGPHGIYVAQGLKKELAQVEVSMQAVRQDIHMLEKTMHQWQTNDFHAEKLAREQLQMARPSEQLYVITEQPIATSV